MKMKYVVSKADGSQVDPGAVYLVLRLDSDRQGRIAALHYASMVQDMRPELSGWIYDECAKYTGLPTRLGGPNHD